MKKSSILILFSDFLKNYCLQHFFLIFLLFSFNFNAQGPGCPNVNAGEDIELDCEQPCTNISATFLETGVTTSYDVSPISYQPPFPTSGGIEVSVFIDDRWSNIIPLPFDFCFYGGTYSEMLIGSNSVITFDTLNNQPDGWCEWLFSDPIPSTNLFNNTIFGPYMDIDPSIDGTGTINYTVFGDVPCRTMVVNFPDIPYYSPSCNQYTFTTQIVMYETTNVIEIYLEDRTDACPTWNNGNAVIGLQNQNGTDGITPPERNTGNWSASNEAWRFTPNGENNVTFSWLNEDNEIIGTDPIVNVCSTNQVTTYTAQAIYTNCNGDVITETDEVTVTFPGAPSISSPISDYRLCDNDGDGSEIFDLTSKYEEIVNTLTDITLAFYNSEADANADTNFIATPSTYISSGTETIWVSLFDNFTQCRVVVPLDLVVSPIPENFQTQEINICDYINVSDLVFDYPDINIYNSPNSILPLNPSTPLNIGTYYISQLNQFGCESIELIDVYMSCFPNIPNGFSPNGDGLNDYFNIQNLYDVYLEHKLKIFNRYGTLVFEGDNSKKWEGYSDSSGNIVPVGTYFYYLELNNLSSDTFTGWVYVNY